MSNTTPILIVEDDSATRLFLRAHLRILNHPVIEARDGREALDLLAQYKCRIVISDWMMPEVDGLELCRRIRARGGDYTYFILLTQQSASDENFSAATAAEVDDFLLKPVVPRELRMRLNVAQRLLQFMARLKQLEAVIPICSYCRKVRDDSQYWQGIENYLHEHTGTLFSHGVCPTCYAQHMQPQIDRLAPEPDDAPRAKAEEAN